MNAPQKFRVPDVEFVGEQDGMSERELKGTLAAAFPMHPAITRAYLARVRYPDSASSAVALCLECADADRQGVLDAVAAIFQPMFNSAMQLDVIFLLPSQHEAIARACEPFYEAN